MSSLKLSSTRGYIVQAGRSLLHHFLNIGVMVMWNITVRIVLDYCWRTFCETYPRVEDNLGLHGGFWTAL